MINLCWREIEFFFTGSAEATHPTVYDAYLSARLGPRTVHAQRTVLPICRYLRLNTYSIVLLSDAYWLGWPDEQPFLPPNYNVVSENVRPLFLLNNSVKNQLILIILG